MLAAASAAAALELSRTGEAAAAGEVEAKRIADAVDPRTKGVRRAGVFRGLRIPSEGFLARRRTEDFSEAFVENWIHRGQIRRPAEDAAECATVRGRHTCLGARKGA